VNVVDMHVRGVGDGEGEEGEMECEDVGPEGRQVEAVEMVHFGRQEVGVRWMVRAWVRGLHRCIAWILRYPTMLV
jgi:hypothetical protein